MAKLTHIDQGGAARMVDVSDKAATERIAIAEGRVRMSAETLELVMSGNAKNFKVTRGGKVVKLGPAEKVLPGDVIDVGERLF